MTKLRSGTNFLRIETGRREGLPSGERMCWFGCDATEDEKHFLMDCRMYEDLRKELRAVEGGGETRATDLRSMLGNGSKESLSTILNFIKRAESRRRRYINK